MTRGIPGSGKSTWARAWVEEDSAHRVRICRDDIRRMFGPYWIPDREPVVKLAAKGLVEAAMAAGVDIVIDEMNVTDKTYYFWFQTVEQHNEHAFYKKQNVYDFESKVFATPLEECIERDSKRPGDACIGREKITRCYQLAQEAGIYDKHDRLV